MVRSLESFVQRHGEGVRTLILEKLKMDPGLNGITLDLPSKRPRKRHITKDKLYRSNVNIRILRRKDTRKRQVSTTNVKLQTLSESSEDFKSELFTIKDILFESYDHGRHKTMGLALFVGYGIKDAAWVDLDVMTTEAKTWWVEEKCRRFPLLDRLLFWTTPQKPNLTYPAPIYPVDRL